MARKQLTQTQKERAVLMRIQSSTYREICEYLNKEGVSITVEGTRKMLLRCEARGTVLRQRGTGRKAKMTNQMKRRIVALTKRCAISSFLIRNRRITIHGIITELCLNVKKTAVSRVLRQAGINSRRPKRVPLLTKEHKRKRMLWGKTNQAYNQQQWRHVLWTDESPFYLRKSYTGRIWRQKG
jgi:hypothetical protein